MKRILAFVFILFIPVNYIFSQDRFSNKSKYSIGFDLQVPVGMVSSTSILSGDQSLKRSFGFGLNIQRKLTQHISMFFGLNIYDYNYLFARQGTDISSIIPVTEYTTNLSDLEKSQLYSENTFGTDVCFDMQATGLKLGAKYFFGKKDFKPWVGVAAGIYDWEANYCDINMEKKYGGARGYVPGFIFLAGSDFKVASNMILTVFTELGSPVAEYSIEGLVNSQWNVRQDRSHIFGPYRFGISFSFVPKIQRKRY